MTRTLYAAFAAIALLVSCKNETSFDKNLHKAKLVPRSVKTTPAITVSVPAEMVETSAKGPRAELDSPPGSTAAHLWISLATDSPKPASVTAAKLQASGVPRDSQFFDRIESPTQVGFSWSEVGMVGAIVYSTSGANSVQCFATIKHLTTPEEKTISEHARFAFEVCKTASVAK